MNDLHIELTFIQKHGVVCERLVVVDSIMTDNLDEACGLLPPFEYLC